jgi:hypothetical protein
MALTKTRTSIWAAQAQAAAATTTSSAVDLSAGYGSAVHLKITNGGTGPTIPAQIQIEVSSDNSAWEQYGGAAIVGSTTNSASVTATVVIPLAVKYLRLVGSANTAQAVTLDAAIVTITAL